jgi:Flp pilus assembly protein protease CpaA
MQEYYFLFVLALIWVVFATLQDLKKREVADWLTYSLIIFALVYRAFYSIFLKDAMFFVYGLLGFVAFFFLAHAFYYGRVFAGGDAKLLMGLGAVIPGGSLNELSINLVFFFFLLFFLGAFYSLTFSFWVVYKRYDSFKKEFLKKIEKVKSSVLVLFIIYVGLLATAAADNFFKFFSYQFSLYFRLSFYLIPFIVFFIILFIYFKALEEGCLIRKMSPWNLSEGDWLERDIKIGKRWIRKSVHGLSIEEIKLLRKAKKKALIREGIPFVPAFLLAFLVMLFVFFVLKSRPEEIFLFLSG